MRGRAGRTRVRRLGLRARIACRWKTRALEAVLEAEEVNMLHTVFYLKNSFSF